MRALFDSRSTAARWSGIGRYAATLPALAAGGLGGHELVDGATPAERTWAEATRAEALRAVRG